LSEIALILSQEDGRPLDEWRSLLRGILDGDEVPTLDLLMKVESLLAGSGAVIGSDDAIQSSLFQALMD